MTLSSETLRDVDKRQMLVCLAGKFVCLDIGFCLVSVYCSGCFDLNMRKCHVNLVVVEYKTRSVTSMICKKDGFFNSF